MQQMSQYTNRLGANIYNKGAFRKPIVQNAPKQEDKPMLINPHTKTWMIWDRIRNEYIDSNISIIKEETKRNENESKSK